MRYKARNAALNDLAKLIMPSLFEDFTTPKKKEKVAELAKLADDSGSEFEDFVEEKKKPKAVGVSFTRVLSAQNLKNDNKKVDDKKSNFFNKKKR